MARSDKIMELMEQATMKKIVAKEISGIVHRIPAKYHKISEYLIDVMVEIYRMEVV